MRAWLAVLLFACGSRGHTGSAVHTDFVVATGYPGASAAAVESSVTTPLERQFGQMAHLVDMRSRSSLGSSRIELAFEPGTDPDAAMREIQAAINASVQLLPRNLPAPPVYSRPGVVVARYAVTSQTLPLPAVRDALEPAEQRVAQAGGVGLVETCGAPRREIDVDVDAAALAAVNVTIPELVAAIKTGNPDDLSPLAGAMHNGAPIDDLSPVVIGTRNGAPIRLLDVARIAHDLGRAECTATTERGRIVELIVWAQPGADRKDVRERVDAVMRDVRTQMPAGLDIQSIGEMRVWTVATEGRAALPRVVEAVSSEHVLIEQRDNTLRVAVEVDDDGVERIRARLAQVPGIVAVETDAFLELTSVDRDQLMAFAATVRAKIGPAIAVGLDRGETPSIELDRDAMGRLGIPASQVDDTLLALGGMTASTQFTQISQTPVIVRVKSEPETLERLFVRTTAGSTVPLSALVRMVVKQEEAERWHAGQFPMIGFRVRAASLPDLAELHVPAAIQMRVLRD